MLEFVGSAYVILVCNFTNIRETNRTTTGYIMNSFDYIIVGAGSAGCVLADKLSRNSKTSVLVLEAGGSDNSPLSLIHI